MNRDDEVAIVGMGCRFPGGASNPDAYWDILKNGTDATVDVPPDRWSLRRFFDTDRDVRGKAYVRRGGFLRESIRGFDAGFFAIAPREGAFLDPQQRLLLEVAWEALEDAGILPAAIRGSRTGVYVGGFTIDNKLHLLNALNREAIATHTAVSATLAMLANRLSYLLDLRGPSMTVDTACSSSLVALHLAVQALRRGECDLALAGGVNLMFRPAYTIAMCKGGFLSPDGRCKSFDASGDGYARGEGAGLLVLKPLARALADRDDIRAVVVETGVNQDGRTDGITLPSPAAQSALIGEILERAGVRPQHIQYLEAHGTGTRAGDATELRSVSEALAARRPAEAGPLLIGSVKSNIGHLEAAAGVAGTIKTTLALEKGAVPPSIHFTSPPQAVDLDALRLEIPVRLREWPQRRGPAMACVNSFGYGGTNAAVLLREAPPRPHKQPPPLHGPLVVPLSAGSDYSLTRQIAALYQVVRTRPDLALADLAYTLARRRTHHRVRAAVTAGSPADLAERLRELVEGGRQDGAYVASVAADGSPSVALIYSGMGPQSWGMGAELRARDRAAAAAYRRCDAIWLRLTGRSLDELLAGGGGEPMLEPRFAQPANLVLQIMVTEAALAYGLQPACFVGHSTGEIAAAWAAGSLDLEDALLLTYHRSRLQQTLVGRGGMLAVGLSAAEATALAAREGAEIDVAAVNGPESATLSGSDEALDLVVRRLEAEGLFHRKLRVRVPYHSRHMDPLEGDFIEALAGLKPRAPRARLFSTVTGETVSGAAQDGRYWWRNLRQPVDLAGALKTMIEAGHRLFLEIGPHPVLAASVLECLRAAKRKGRCVPTLRRGEDEQARVAGAVAELYAHGADLDWALPHPDGNLVRLPPYAWDRADLWTESQASRHDRIWSDEHPFVARTPGEPIPTWDGDLSGTFHGFLADHRIAGEALFPAAGFVELALAASRNRSGSMAVERLRLVGSLSTFETPVLRMLMDERDGAFQILARERRPDAPWHTCARGRLPRFPAPPPRQPLDRDAIARRCPTPFDAAGFYRRAESVGFQYGEAFRCLRSGQIGRDGEGLFRLELGSAATWPAEDFFIHPCLLDAAFQSALALQLGPGPGAARMALPVEIRELRFHRKPDAAVWCQCRIGPAEDGGFQADIALAGDDGQVQVEVRGLCVRPLSTTADAERASSGIVFANRWVPCPGSPADTPLPRKWLVFADAAGTAQCIAERAAPHSPCILVGAGQGFRRLDDWRFEVRRGSREDLRRLASELATGELAGILFLWPLDAPDDLSEGEAARRTGGQDTIDFMHIAQVFEPAAAAAGASPRALVCTVGTQSVCAADRIETAPGQHALWGAVRSMRPELACLRPVLVDLGARLPFACAKDLLAEMAIESPEVELAYRQAARHANRVVLPTEQGSARWRPTSDTQIALRALGQGGERRRGFVESPHAPLAPGEVRVAVRRWAFTEPDHAALKRAAGALPALALQCLGRVAELGEGVDGLAPDRDVLLLGTHPTLASHLCVPASLLLPLPELFCGDGAIAALDWLAAYHVLFHAGGLRAGQTVLIARAASGLGSAALLLAGMAGARAIVAEEGPARLGYLKACGCELVSDASSLALCDDAETWTGGEGVDLALSLVDSEQRDLVLRTVREGGCFVDLSPLGSVGCQGLSIAAARPGVSVRQLDVYRAFGRRPDLARDALRGLRDLLAGRPLPAIPAAILEAWRIEEAIARCADDDHVGKVVVDLEGSVVPIARRAPARVATADATYLVTGGFGGIGCEALRWLQRQGARHIVAVSRSGPATDAARRTLAELREAGVRLVPVQADVSDGAALAHSLEGVLADLPPVRGILHGAGVLADASLDAMEGDLVHAAMRPKAQGALHLHRLTAGMDLDFFVCLSSVAATFGNPGQLNYAAANGFLNGLVQWRRSAGRPGTCVNLGPVAEVGMAARDPRVLEHLERRGLTPLSTDEVFAVLDEALAEDWSCFDLVRIDIGTWSERLPAGERLRLSELPRAGQSAGDAAPALRERVLALDPTERRALIFGVLADICSAVLQVPRSRIDATTTLGELGVDSLMAAEIVAEIAERTGILLRTLFVVRGPALSQMAETVETALLTGAQPHSVLGTPAV